MDVNVYIASLVQYGLDKKLIEPCDTIYVTNQILDAMKLDSFEPADPEPMSLEEILNGLLEDAVGRNVCDDDITSRDLFDTKLMGILTPMPREIRKTFAKLYAEDPVKATDWYYKLSQDTDYIRRYRIKKDIPKYKRTGREEQIMFFLSLSPVFEPVATTVFFFC